MIAYHLEMIGFCLKRLILMMFSILSALFQPFFSSNLESFQIGFRTWCINLTYVVLFILLSFCFEGMTILPRQIRDMALTFPKFMILC